MERRKAERVTVDVEVDYHCEDTFLFTYVADVSAHGIFVRSKNPHPPGTQLFLRFTPPGADKALVLEGEVIWTNTAQSPAAQQLQPGMGIRFLELDEATHTTLLELISAVGGGDQADSEPDA